MFWHGCVANPDMSGPLRSPWASAERDGSPTVAPNRTRRCRCPATRARPRQALLQTRELTKEFRGFRAVSDVASASPRAPSTPSSGQRRRQDHPVQPADRLPIPTSGQILFHGQDITGRQPEQIAHLGIARSFQITSLFDPMTPSSTWSSRSPRPTGLGCQFWRSSSQMRQLPRPRHGSARPGGPRGPLRAAGRLARLRAEARRSSSPSRWRSTPSSCSSTSRPLAWASRTSTAPSRSSRRSREGRTVVFVDHNMHVVGSSPTRVTVLQSGEMLAEGRLRRRPAPTRASSPHTWEWLERNTHDDCSNLSVDDLSRSPASPRYGEARVLTTSGSTSAPGRSSPWSAATALARRPCCAR